MASLLDAHGGADVVQPAGGDRAACVPDDSRLRGVKAKEERAREQLAHLVSGLSQLYSDATRRRTAADELQRALDRRRL